MREGGWRQWYYLADSCFGPRGRDPEKPLVPIDVVEPESEESTAPQSRIVSDEQNGGPPIRRLDARHLRMLHRAHGRQDLAQSFWPAIENLNHGL